MQIFNVASANIQSCKYRIMMALIFCELFTQKYIQHWMHKKKNGEILTL